MKKYEDEEKYRRKKRREKMELIRMERGMEKKGW